MRITTGLVFAIYTTSLIVFGKPGDCRTLTGVPVTLTGHYYPVDVEAANVEDYAPRTIMTPTRPLPFYHAVPLDAEIAASDNGVKRTEFSERERRATLGIGEHMARLRRGSITFGEEMARLRRGSVNGGEEMARLRRAILGEHMARLRRSSWNMAENMARL